MGMLGCSSSTGKRLLGHREAIRPACLIRPTDDYDRFFLAEWQRRKGRLEEAESGLQSLERDSSDVPKQLILQSRARINAAQGKNSDVENCVTESIAFIRTLGDADLVFEDNQVASCPTTNSMNTGP